MNKRGLAKTVAHGVIASDGDAYLSLRALARYASLSVRTLRGYLTAKRNPLPCYRPGGKVLVRRSEFDAWMRAFRDGASGEDRAREVNRLIDELCTDLERPLTAPGAGQRMPQLPRRAHPRQGARER
jgi:excisionase family DNA binding protein